MIKIIKGINCNLVPRAFPFSWGAVGKRPWHRPVTCLSNIFRETLIYATADKSARLKLECSRRQFRFFGRKTHIFETVNRKKTAKEYWRVSSPGIEELTAEKSCFEYKLLFYQAGRQHGGRIELLNGGLRRECSSAFRNSTHK